MAALALALLALAPPPRPAAPEPATLTRAEVRTMPAEALTRRLFGDLAHIMFPQPFYDEGRPRESLSALGFLTRPYRTGLSGVCQTDLFFVGFEPVPGAQGDDRPVRPARVQMYGNSYFVRDLAQARRGALTEQPQAEQRACAGIDPRTVTRIIAVNPGAVVGAVQRFAGLLDGARAGRVDATLSCADPAGTALDDAGCRAMLARYRADRIHVVVGVPGCGRNATDVWCERIETSADDNGPRMEIVFETPRGDRPGIPPSRIRIAPVEDVLGVE